MSRNSVLGLEEFGVRRFAVMQEEILKHCEGNSCWSLDESEGRKERAFATFSSRRGDFLNR